VDLGGVTTPPDASMDADADAEEPKDAQTVDTIVPPVDSGPDARDSSISSDSGGG